MAFLILTEHGYRKLTEGAGARPSPLWINPGILDNAEMSRLRAEGVQMTVLAQALSSQDHAEIEQLVQQISDSAGGPVWVEHPASEAGGSGTASAQPGAESPISTMPARGATDKRSRARAAYSRTMRYIKRMTASDGEVTIIPYMSYGTSRQLRVQGRVLKNKNFGASDPDQGAWANFIEFYKQLGTDEVPGARLVARFGDVEQEAVADDDGYFHVELALPDAIEGSGWQSVELELLHPAPRTEQRKRVQAIASVLIPSTSARFGVISDIDDTVLWSNVGNKFRMLKMLAVSNAHTRKPFKGVTAFYCALQQGAGGNENNPIFYVSSSPWHLYTQLVDFFEAQGIPLGPLVLKQLGVKALFGSSRHHDHKLASIERILHTYPDLPFILIGDSGQHDPEIYKEIVERYPQRIKAIYIRNVNPDPARIEAIDRLIDEVKATSTQLLLVPDSEFAAMHAAGEGWIKAGELNLVRADKRDDERLTNPRV